MKDYTLAEKLVKELSEIGERLRYLEADSPPSRPRKQVSALHLAKARNAAVSGDRATLETELKEATEIWPRNPALAEVSGLIFSQADVQQKALVDLDQLISQHNYRQIYNDKMRFIAASAMYPDRQEQLKKVLDQMQVIETAIIQAQEMEKRGDYAGAWETLEKIFKQFPDDSKLNQLRANLTTEAADFVRTLRTAQDMEQKRRDRLEPRLVSEGAEDLSRERVRAGRDRPAGEEGAARELAAGLCSAHRQSPPEALINCTVACERWPSSCTAAR